MTTVMMIADQMISRLEQCHNRGIIHRDIKPENIVIGPISDPDTLFLIDFGLAKRFIKNGRHIPPKQRVQIVGTLRFCSFRTHCALEQSRRDDLESLGYTLVYLAKGKLPWQNRLIQDIREKIALIGRMKNETSTRVLCRKLPQCFRNYFDYVGKLGYTQKPQYKLLKK